MLRRVGWLKTEDSGAPIGPIFKGQVLNIWSLKMGPIGSAETSILINLCCLTSQKTEEFKYWDL
jgi:hypothetical protein